MKKYFISAMLSALLFLTGCSAESSPEPVQGTFFAMDTVMDFTIYGESGLIDQSESLIASLESLVSVTDANSELYHYCDSMGFQELPAFQKPENYLKAAEMSMEDDYGMIDGIINNGPKQPTVADIEAQVKAGMSISLMDLAEAAHREKKKSVLEQLKSQPAQERPHKTAPKKSAEKEL